MTRSTKVNPPTKVDILKPVWLFSDDLDGLVDLLEKLGSVKVYADKTSLGKHQQILKQLPVSLLRLSVPGVGISVVIHPKQVEVRRPYSLNPSSSEADVVSQVQDFLASRRHPVYLLGERGWQLAAMCFAFGLLLPMTLSHLLFDGANSVLKLVSMIGILIGGIIGTLAFVGLYIPNGSHVTIWDWTRTSLSRRVRKIARYIGSLGFMFSFGLFVGSRGANGGWGWLILLGLVAAVSTVIWLFGFLLPK